MKTLRILVLTFLVALCYLPAQAQNTPAQQTATMPNAAAKAAVNNGAVANQVSATATPSGSNYVYVTGVFLGACQDATGVASTNANFNWTAGITGNVNGASNATVPVWSVSQPLVVESCNWKITTFPTPLKSSTPGAAVTLQSPASATHTAWLVEFFWYEAQ